MANQHISHGEAKSICDSLECSPSQHDDHGKYGGKPNIQVTAKGSEAVTGGTHLATHTSEFKMKDRGNALPHYKDRFAGSHPQNNAHTKASGGKS